MGGGGYVFTSGLVKKRMPTDRPKSCPHHPHHRELNPALVKPVIGKPVPRQVPHPIVSLIERVLWLCLP